MTVIRVVDLETTGLASTDQVCEVAYCDVVSQKTDDQGNPIAWTVVEGSSTFLSITGEMPPEVSAVHHIIAEDLVGAPLLGEIAPIIFQSPTNRPFYLAAHNCKFERQFLTPEFTGNVRWICTYKAACRIWPDAPSHANQVLRYWRKPEGLVREKAGAAHRAFGDAYVTAYLLRDLLEFQTVEKLVEWSDEPVILTTVSFGKHQGKSWTEVPSDYLEWMLAQDFDEDRVHTAKYHLDKRKTPLGW
jgi:exodeoxyribonuclease X